MRRSGAQDLREMVVQMLQVIFDEEPQGYGIIASHATWRFEPALRYAHHNFSKQTVLQCPVFD